MTNDSSDYQRRVDQAVELVREVSMQTDPQEMVRKYRDRVRAKRPAYPSISLSRRGLSHPRYRITRANHWSEEINPWKEPHRLPHFDGGLLSELIYGNQPRIIRDLKVDAQEPAAEYLDGHRSLIAIPLYDRGESLNMVIRLMPESEPADLESLPDQIITANLFGRATHNLVLADEVRRAYQALDSEFKAIAMIQRSLLPQSVPQAAGLEMAAYYETAHRAGGDYYDCFPLSNSRSGVLIADVSGHGAAAAMVMARVHAALHAHKEVLHRPAETMCFVNEHLLVHCESTSMPITFVTAFYGIFDADTRRLQYTSAGHNPPRWRSAKGCLCSIAGAREIPLGIQCGVRYEEDSIGLSPGDEVLLYTDGIVEAANGQGEMFGTGRLDEAIIRPHGTASTLVKNISSALETFVDSNRAMDDQTMLALRVAS